MNKRDQLHPPSIARWLLNHFGCSPNNDAVIGDLDERYRTRRHSAAWYWRQVFIAVVAGIYSRIRPGGDIYMKQAAKWAFIIVGVFSLGFWMGRSPLMKVVSLSSNEMRIPSRNVQLDWDRFGAVEFLQMEIKKEEARSGRDKFNESDRQIERLRRNLEQAKAANDRALFHLYR